MLRQRNMVLAGPQFPRHLRNFADTAGKRAQNYRNDPDQRECHQQYGDETSLVSISLYVPVLDSIEQRVGERKASLNTADFEVIMSPGTVP